MQDVAAATVRALLAGFRAAGLDGDALLAAAGIAPAALEPADATLPADRFPALWQAAFRQAPREELPTEVGLGIPFGAFGALDYLAGSSPTVEAAFHSLRGHFRQVAHVTLGAVADHLDHICQLAGDARHCGIGSDLDGGYGQEQAPQDVNTIADVQRLGPILERRGYSAGSRP